MPYDSAFLNTWDADLGSGARSRCRPSTSARRRSPASASRSASRATSTCWTRPTWAGYRQGPSGSDDIVQRLGPFGGAWSKPAVWPGDGGYVVRHHGVGRQHRLGHDRHAPGVQVRARRQRQADVQPGRLVDGCLRLQLGLAGGHLELAPNRGRRSSGSIWSPDGSGTNSQLRAYDPVPVDGTMNLRYSTPIGQSSKFSVPVISNNRVILGHPRRQDPQLRLADQRRR